MGGGGKSAVPGVGRGGVRGPRAQGRGFSDNSAASSAWRASAVELRAESPTDATIK